MAALVLLLIWLANFTKRYTRSVADFLVASRCASRYMLAVAGNMSSLGAITIMGSFEMYYHGGFSAAWWSMLMMPVGIIVALSGWLVYRFRQTRVLTLAQFFEIRYSKRFRIFTGVLGFISGTLNFGIFPAVGARFFIYFCGLPDSVACMGMAIPMYPLVIAILIGI